MLSSFGQKLLWRRTLDYLDTYHPQIIGIAGSIGKTTTKQAIALALQGNKDIFVAPQPYNDPLGVALGILGVDTPPAARHWFNLLTGSLVRELKEPEANTLLLELGARRPGDMDFLATRLPINLAVVTNVGGVNTEIFGSKEMVAHEINSLPASLSDNATAILNIDDPLVADMAAHMRAHVITFGTDQAADIKLIRHTRLSHGGLAIEVNIAGKTYELHLRHILCRRQISSILAALAVANFYRLDLKATAARLQNFVPPSGRMRLTPGRRGARLLDDSYDASPESVLSGLETMRALSTSLNRSSGRRISILGDITHLGSESFSVHKKTGKFAGELSHVFIAVGERMRDAATEGILVGADVHHFEDARDVGKWFADFIHQDDLIYITGSNDMNMTEVVKQLSG
ncbi:MAG: Mur ligase family protein [bacterium]|nr:Mur ligase family protein [bacterium]MDZ4342316.1 Mur ligase family protein [Candidatus Binatia bacterium]